MVSKKHVVIAGLAGFAAAYLFIALELKVALRSLAGQGEKQGKAGATRVIWQDPMKYRGR